MKARRRIIPIGDVCPVTPRELSRRIAIDGMLKHPGRLRLIVRRHAATSLTLGSSRENLTQQPLVECIRDEDLIEISSTKFPTVLHNVVQQKEKRMKFGRGSIRFIVI